MKDRFGVDWTGIQGFPFWRKPLLGRRMFFRHVASAVGGWFLLPGRPMETIARADDAVPIGAARNCIFVLMAGAPSHVDTFDLKEGPWTPKEFNPTSYGDLRFPQGLMPKLAEQLDSIAFVRSMRAWALVHSLGQTWVQIGRNPIAGALAKVAPHIGSVVAIELGAQNPDAALPVFVSLNASGGVGSGYLPPVNAPFYVSPGGAGLPNTTHRDGQPRFESRYALLTDLDGERANPDLGAPLVEMASFNQSARKLMYSPAVDRVFTFDAAERARFGNSGFGNACITARNLLRAQMGTRFVQITVGSWDNHSNIYQTALNAANANSLAHQFDNGLGALIADLRNDGLLDDTLIVALGEFGRTVGSLNAQSGRDHFLQQSVMFAGGKIRGGRALGATDGEGRNTVETGWYRDREVKPEDVEATIYSALGINWATVRHDDPLGRGFEYVPFSDRDLYGPIHELWR